MTDTDTLQPISGGSGMPASVPVSRDPFELLDELMEVVEQLCPEWPERSTFEHHRTFLL